MTCKVIVGGFYGDEGKGKIIAYLSIKDKPKIAVRGELEQMLATPSFTIIKPSKSGCCQALY